MADDSRSEPSTEIRQSTAADHLSLRRHNLSVVLRALRDNGPRARARIAADTGLNKATVSSLVAELAELGLVRDGTVERAGGIGRPGQAVEIDGRICGLGAEVNVDYIAVLVLDLRGEQVLYARTPLDVPSLGVESTLDVLATAIATAIETSRQRGRDVSGITVAVPGLVESTRGVVRNGPNIGWQDVQLAEGLTARLARPSLPVRVDNDANLCALAEYVAGSCAGTSDLVYLTGETGVGGGIIADGRLLRGAEGFGGEVGHMPTGDPLQPCGCGRSGCWETAVGLAALLREVADPGDSVTDPSVDLEVRLAEIRRRAELGDGRTLRGLEAVGTSLGLGASILVGIVNPKVLMLGGYFAVLGEFIVGAMDAELDKRAVEANRGGCRIELSTLGFTAACLGGAQVALEAVIVDPASVVNITGSTTTAAPAAAASPTAAAGPSTDGSGGPL